MKIKTRTISRHRLAHQRLTGRRLLVQSLEDRRLLAAGPYAPAAGVDGSDAISRTDPAIVGWATAVADYTPGSNVDAEWTDASNAIGIAEGEFNTVVSLGRGGSLTLTFNTPIRDGLGDDFAVFENSFSDTFLELGFVEVSSDGINFHRFASDSQTDVAVGSFGLLDPTNFHNLAGKYRAGFGTPFDLGELRGGAGLDVTAVTHVRLVDIVGDGNTIDASGDPIYDPTPTAGSAGLDVDGVAVINAQATGEIVVDFETLGNSLPGSLFDNGVNANGGFTEQEITLNNDFSTQFQTWSGWSVSQATDTTTAGFTNQYSNITGTGNNGSATFAVGFFDSSPSNPLPPPTITLDPSSGSRFDSFYVTNTTYATLSMRAGDGFAKKFGGVSGNDPDHLQMIVTGVDATGNSVGTVTVDLADYRFADNSQDFILDAWTKVDVSSLSDARSLSFSLTSTDSNGFGMLTPAYFAVDDVTLSRPAVAFDTSSPITTEDQSVTGRVSRSTSDTSAPLIVTLERTGSDQVNLPTTVTVPAGASFVDFTINPVNDAIPTPDRSLQIVASADNLLSTTRSLLIQDDEALVIAFANSVVDVTEGTTEAVNLTLSRNDPDISQPLTVAISHNGGTMVGVPSTVTFAADTRDVSIPLTIMDNTQLDGSRSVSITASVSDRANATATLNITDDDLPSLLANPNFVVLNEDTPSVSQSVTITRNTTDLTTPVTVNLTLLDGGPLVVPASVVIPAGATSTTVIVSVTNDALQNSRASYRVQAANAAFVSSIIEVRVTDNDQASIQVNLQDTSGSAITSIAEGSGFRVQVRRIATPLDQPQVIDLSGRLNGAVSDRIVGPTQVTIPAGSNQAIANFSITQHDGPSEDLPLTITASASGMPGVSQTIQVTDADLPALDIVVDGGSLSEANAATVIDFEKIGRGLLADEFDNNAGEPAGFVSGPLSFQNSFDNSFGFDSWSGFAVSRETDTQTAGFLNQYSAFPGIGASGSGTYGIAFASSPVTISRELDSAAFDSFAITNTTYAALSMRDGDQFAKQFGGETGDDPDFFLLTIDGLDQDGNSLGQIEFYLADYRFADNSLDYLISDWTTVDVSSLSQAVTLSMQLSSSDVGSFGMNTPGYFAIDDVALVSDSSMVEVVRSGSDTSEAVTILLTSDQDDATLPASVVIPAGSSSVEVPVRWRNDELSNGDRTMRITANADGFTSVSKEVSLVDDDMAALMLIASSTDLVESDGMQTIGFEDVGSSLSDETFANGANRRGSFQSGSIEFANAFNPAFGSWSGWAYSNVTDVLTPGFANQFAAYTGGGAEDSATFAVAGGYGATPPTIVMPSSFQDATFQSIQITNTTYAALSMLEGDSFAKKFGGETGDDPDFFLLTIDGFDANGDVIGSTDFYLADYRFADNSLDYVVDQWTTVDLSSIADAASLQFRLSSSDVGDFGMNTPAYFAIDQLVIDRGQAAAPTLTVHRNTSDLSTEVVVNLESDTASRLTAPSTITIPFGSDRVRVPLSIVDDAMYQPVSDVVITASASGFEPVSQSFSIQNDELPRILLNSVAANSVAANSVAANIALTEGGPSSVVSVRLETAPASDVVVEINGDEDQIRLDATSLTFTPDNWNQPQVLLVSGKADLVVEEDAVIPITFTGVDYASSRAWLALADYQPSRLAIINESGRIQLVDDTRNLTFTEFPTDEDIQIVLNDEPQRLTMEAIAGVHGLIQIDTKAGDDTVVITTTNFTSVDGGEGQDTVIIAPQDLADGEALDLASWLRHRIVRFETIVLGSADSGDDVSMRFALDSGELKSWFGDSPPRLVTSANQILNLSGNWQLGLPTLEDGIVTGRLVGEGVEVTVSTERPWQNFLTRADVNASGDVTAADALRVINWLNANPSSDLPTPGSIDELQNNFVDVSGDGLVTATDALQVINYLNAMEPSSEPQSTLAVAPIDMILAPSKNGADRDHSAMSSFQAEQPQVDLVETARPSLSATGTVASINPAAADVALADLGLLRNSEDDGDSSILNLLNDSLDSDA